MLPHVSRRDFLLKSGMGLGAVAVSAMGQIEAQTAFRQTTVIDPVRPLTPRMPHFVPRAKQVIFLFQYGGPPHTDTFDYKPELVKLAGQSVPESIKAQHDKVGGVFGHCHDRLLAGPFKFNQHGDSGLWISECFPHLAQHADTLCLVRSMVSESSNHAPATIQMNTGVTLSGKPSLGTWLTYGLGTENQNLPGFVVLFEVGGLGGSANWTNAFLPAAFQGTRFRYAGEPALYLRPPAELRDVQRSTLDAVQAFNRAHQKERPGMIDLEGRIASYELAYRMQSEALDAGDLSRETAATLDMYGVNDSNPTKAKYARMCLLSRRLIEKGVRVVQSYNSVDKSGWDGHEKNTEYIERNAAQTDQPIAALLSDLAQRGLLDETLVVWAGEFGRTPMEQGAGGRNHNPYGFTVWLAGGGVRGGQAIGATDEIGLRAIEEPHSVKDLHATILTAMGLRAEDLFFEHNGRPERLTGVAGTSKPIARVFG